MADVEISEAAQVARPRGRQRARLKLAEADRLRSEGRSWSEISATLGVHRNTLLNHRRANYSPRMVPIQQKTLLRLAARYLRADAGGGLTPIELKDAKALARLLWLLSTENKSLREALAKARQAIKDYERMVTR